MRSNLNPNVKTVVVLTQVEHCAGLEAVEGQVYQVFSTLFQMLCTGLEEVEDNFACNLRNTLQVISKVWLFPWCKCI